MIINKQRKGYAKAEKEADGLCKAEEEGKKMEFSRVQLLKKKGNFQISL